MNEERKRTGTITEIIGLTLYGAALFALAWAVIIAVMILTGGAS